MKAYELRSFEPDGLVLTDRPQPDAPPAHHVLLRMRAASLNYRDLLLRKGLYNPKLVMPRVPASDGVGEVVTVGSDVSRVKPGERVIRTFFPRWLDGELSQDKVAVTLGSECDGVMSEYCLAHEDTLVPVPAHLTDVEAATLPCAALTAWQALFVQDRIQPGSSVLILGTGGVAIFALQFARRAGARVFITSSSDEKLQKAKAMGADVTINYQTQSRWGNEVRRLTSGRGVDHVLEVGGSGTFPQSALAVRRGGTISLIGVVSGLGGIDVLPIIMNAIRVQGIFVSSRRELERMTSAIDLHGTKPVVDKVFAFDELPAALDYLATARHFGKVCLAF